MFIAHLPAGYLLTRQLAKDSPDRAGLMLTGLCASVIPDLDLFWFYLIDNRQNVHHGYVFHMPLFWGVLAALAFGAARLLRLRRTAPFIRVALLCLLLHMALDSVAAEIAWLAPLLPYEINLAHVPARHDWWVWNFVLHWTFLPEIVITAAAALTFWRDHEPDPPRDKRFSQG